jgi:hypothetical protein
VLGFRSFATATDPRDLVTVAGDGATVASFDLAVRPTPPSPSRTNWTRLVPPPVLIGHVSWTQALMDLGCDAPQEFVELLLTAVQARRL